MAQRFLTKVFNYTEWYLQLRGPGQHPCDITPDTSSPFFETQIQSSDRTFELLTMTRYGAHMRKAIELWSTWGNIYVRHKGIDYVIPAAKEDVEDFYMEIYPDRIAFRSAGGSFKGNNQVYYLVGWDSTGLVHFFPSRKVLKKDEIQDLLRQDRPLVSSA